MRLEVISLRRLRLDGNQEIEFKIENQTRNCVNMISIYEVSP
jgi:hypothetical protein